MVALAKGCHKLWVTRHTNNWKISPSRKGQETEAIEYDVLTESEMSWANNVFGDTCLSQYIKSG